MFIVLVAGGQGSEKDLEAAVPADAPKSEDTKTEAASQEDKDSKEEDTRTPREKFLDIPKA